MLAVCSPGHRARKSAMQGSAAEAELAMWHQEMKAVCMNASVAPSDLAFAGVQRNWCAILATQGREIRNPRKRPVQIDCCPFPGLGPISGMLVGGLVRSLQSFGVEGHSHQSSLMVRYRHAMPTSRGDCVLVHPENLTELSEDSTWRMRQERGCRENGSLIGQGCGKQ